MTEYGYSIKDMNETRAHAVIKDVAISYKVAVLIAQRIKGMPAEQALRFLADVQTQKQAVPYTKFNDSVGHRPGIGPGRYPQKAAKMFEGLLKNAIANAEDRNMGKDVWVEFVVAQQASRAWHPGRVGRRKFKRSHVELVVTNVANPKTLKTESRTVKKQAKPAKEKKSKENN